MMNWTQIKEVLRTQPGDTPVYLYPMDTKKKTLAARRYWCKPDIAFLTKITLSHCARKML